MSSIKLDKSTIAVVYAQIQASKSTLSRALSSLNNWAKVESGLNIFSRFIYTPGLKDGDPPLIDYRDNAKSYINSANSICTHVGYLDKVINDFDSLLDALDGIKDAIEDFELQPICLAGEDPSKYGFITNVQLTSGRYGYNEEMGIDINSELMDPEYMLATLGNSGNVTDKDLAKVYGEWLTDYGKWVNEQTKAYVTEKGAAVGPKIAWFFGPLANADTRENVKNWASNFSQTAGALIVGAKVYITDGADGYTSYLLENQDSLKFLYNMSQNANEVVEKVNDTMGVVTNVVMPTGIAYDIAKDLVDQVNSDVVDDDVNNAHGDWLEKMLLGGVGCEMATNGVNAIWLSGDVFEPLYVINEKALEVLNGVSSEDGMNVIDEFGGDFSDTEERPAYLHGMNEGFSEIDRGNAAFVAVSFGAKTVAKGAVDILASKNAKVDAELSLPKEPVSVQTQVSVPVQTQTQTPAPVQTPAPAPVQTSTPAAPSGGNSGGGGGSHAAAPAQSAPAPATKTEAPKTNTPTPVETPKAAPAETPKAEVKPEPASNPSEGSSKPNIETVKPEVKTVDVPKDNAATSVIDVVKSHADSDKVASAGVAAMTVGVGSALSKTVPGVNAGGGSSVSIPEVSLGGGGNMNVPSATTATIGGSSGGMGGASGMSGSYGMGSGSGVNSSMGLGTSGSGDLSMTSSGITQTGGGLTASNSGTIPNSGRVYNNNTFADQLEQSTRNQEARSASTVKAGTSSTSANSDATQTDSKTQVSKNHSNYTNVGDEKTADSEARKKMQDLSKKIDAPDENKEETSDKKRTSDNDKKEVEEKKNTEQKTEEKKDTNSTTRESLSADEGLVGSNAGYITSKDKTISKVAVEITAGEIIISAVLFALKVLNILAFVLVIVAIALLYTTYRITHKKIIEKRKKQYLISIEKVQKEEKIEDVSEVTADDSTSMEPEQVINEQVTEQAISSEDSVVEENKEVETDNNKDLIIPPMKDNPNYEEFGTGLDFVDKE